MIRVVLDANVFVSAVLNPSSNPGRIVDLGRTDKIRLLVSPDILSELKIVLSYPHLKKIHRKSPEWIKTFIMELAGKAEMTPGRLVVDAIRDDPSDNIYLVCAVEGKAEFIISGDRHLKDLKMFRGIRIVDPTAFLEIMANPISFVPR